MEQFFSRLVWLSRWHLQPARSWNGFTADEDGNVSPFYRPIQPMTFY